MNISPEHVNTIIAILGVVGGGYAFYFGSKYNDKRQCEELEKLNDRIKVLESNDRERDIAMAEIKSRLASIETNIFWIKDMLIEKQRALQNDNHITHK